ncbi:MAG: RNA polymerase sigma factor [Verrucomicrobia bacterium]|nr:RNA polymerase sigma factor [Verrucomicrobiota bacterium]
MLVVAERQPSLVQAARAGNPDAWEALFHRYQLPLYVYLVELVHDRQTSLDLVQETFVNAARHLDTLRADDKFGSWLFSIAHQKWLQYARKRRLETVSLDDGMLEIPDADATTPETWLLRQEQAASFLALLQRLPAAHRAVLLLHFVEDFSLHDIARITGTPVGTVKSRLHYAKQTLRKLIEDQP